jgi:hypothetical protein
MSPDRPTTPPEPISPDESTTTPSSPETSPRVTARPRRAHEVVSSASDRSHWQNLTYSGAKWTQVLFMGAICFGLWFILDAPSLQRSAQASPIGMRRTVSMDVVGPFAALSRTVGLSNAVGWTDAAIGRATPGAGPSLSKLKHAPVPPPTTVPAGGTAGSTTTTTYPVLNTNPTPANPLKVLVVGDSVGIDLGEPLVSTLGTTGNVATYLDGRVDTGLTRPDYFNWPAELGIDLANQQPQLVVVMMGANDPQGLVDGSTTYQFGSPGWNDAYSRRVGAFLDQAHAAGARVLWVGQPPMANPVLDQKIQVLNSLVQAQVAQRKPYASYLSSTPSLGNAQGRYTAFITDAGGAVITIRTPDGIHVTRGGGQRLTTAVIGAMGSDFGIHLNP